MLRRATVIHPTRFLRRGVLACLRAGWSLRELQETTCVYERELRRLVAGEYHWATTAGAETVLQGLPPSVRRAVAEPTYAVALDCFTGGRVPVSLLRPFVAPEVERHGYDRTSRLLGVSDWYLTRIMSGQGSVSFAAADTVLTRSGEAMRWHSDERLRRVYFTLSTPRSVLVSGHRPPVGWKKRPKLVAA